MIYLSFSLFFLGTSMCSSPFVGASFVLCAESDLCLCSSRISFIVSRTDFRLRSGESEIPLSVFPRGLEVGSD